jgi:hypothetical protein
MYAGYFGFSIAREPAANMLTLRLGRVQNPRYQHTALAQRVSVLQIRNV